MKRLRETWEFLTPSTIANSEWPWWWDPIVTVSRIFCTDSGIFHSWICCKEQYKYKTWSSRQTRAVSGVDLSATSNIWPIKKEKSTSNKKKEKKKETPWAAEPLFPSKKYRNILLFNIQNVSLQFLNSYLVLLKKVMQHNHYYLHAAYM